MPPTRMMRTPRHEAGNEKEASHMKRLIAAMTDNLQKYEAKYGVVDAGDPSLPVH